MSKNPSDIMHINKGLIKSGYEADLVLVDLEKENQIDVSSFRSKGKNSPFDGYKVFSEVLLTIKKGANVLVPDTSGHL